ncbi:MAG: PKD domain-containing protein [Pirellulaceae bacterium]
MSILSFSSQRGFTSKHSKSPRRAKNDRFRRLTHEPLEERALLSVVSETIWDHNGDGLSPADTGQDLCTHGYTMGVTETKNVSVPAATEINEVSFELFYTSCGTGGSWSFYLNEELIGTEANTVYDCTCNPTVNWPMTVTIGDSATLMSHWNMGGNNELKVVPSGAHLYASYYGATIDYQTTLHPSIVPDSQAVEVGEVVSFDASGSYSDTGSIVSYTWDFGDGTTATGITATHVYERQGEYQTVLTVEDDAGLTSVATSQVTVSGAPEVACVPWRYGLPHETWNGNTVILKGTAKDLDLPLSYTWDFGDGTSPVSGTITSEASKYAIEATHTYPDSSSGTPYTATLTVTDPSGNSASDQYSIVVKEQSLDVERSVAIDDGLWNLHKQMQRYDSGTVAAGSWRWGGYTVATTSAAVLAFEVQGHLATGDAAENPYVETVQRGLNHLFTQMYTRAIPQGSQCPYGDPDTNGNGLGIDTYGSRHTYEIGMAMMAVSASGAPLRVAETGESGVVGRTYYDIVTDMVDMCAWGQNEDSSWRGRGGWRYDWNYESSDNSITQWPVIGLEAAETNWGITAPGFVKDELELWLNYSQSNSGTWGYTTPNYWDNPAKAGAGIAGINYLGYDSSDQRIQDALAYLDSRWNTTGQDGTFGEKYAMYGIMKGMRTAEPEIVMIGSHDWFSEFSDYLVDQQNADGSWPDTSSWTGGLLDTAWSLLILTPTVASPPPVADLVATPRQAQPGQVFQFDASSSYHLNSERTIVEYDFDFGDGTTYTETADSAPDGTFDGITTHQYGITAEQLGELPGQAIDYTVVVTVTDDDPEGAKTDTASEVVVVSLDNHPPVADPGGPYTGYQSMPLFLSGADSYDPDQGPPLYNHITSWEWELDGVAPYGFNDATGETTTWTWTTPGTYNVGLKVTDLYGETHEAWTQVVIEEAIPTEMFMRERHVNYSDTVDLHGRLKTAAGDPVEGKTLDFYVDRDKDGSFDPAPLAEGGEYVGSAVTDSDGSAYVDYTSWDMPDNYVIRAEFAGDAQYLTTFGTTGLRVDQEQTVVTYTGATSGHNGETTTLSAVLSDDDGQVLIENRNIDFVLGEQGGSRLTEIDGVGAINVVLNQPVGAYTVESSFAGCVRFAASPVTSVGFEIPNTAPTATDNSYTTDEDIAMSGNVLTDGVADSDPDPGQTLVASLHNYIGPGTVLVSDDGSFTYTPDAGFTGSDSFVYAVTDGIDTVTATVSITVNNLVDLSGRVFDDLNDNGDQDAGEPGIEGVTVQLYEGSNLKATVTTNSDGDYVFDANLGAGTYRIVESQPTGYLDGDETAPTTPPGGTVDNSMDWNEITNIVVTAGDPDASGYLFAEIQPSDIQGMVWEDFNNDGGVNFGEKAIPGVTVTLTGTDDRGNAVAATTDVTDDDGMYMFIDLRPGTYTIAETQPDVALWVDAKDVVGEVNGTTSGENDGGTPPLSTTNDQFENVVLPGPDSVGVNYNFGERPVAEGVVTPGQTATIGFWQNKNGQALIRSLNGSEDSLELGNWLAATFPNMYGDPDRTDEIVNPNDLFEKTNVEVADFYSSLFLRKKKEAQLLGLTGPTKMDAQVMGVALACYVTNGTLAGTTAESYGFLVTEHGVGTSTFDIGTEAADAFNGLTGEVCVMDLLFATDDLSWVGVLYDLNHDNDTDDDDVGGLDETLLRTLANDVYSAINEAGDI